MSYDVLITNKANISTVKLKMFKGKIKYTALSYKLTKFPGHCGATIIYDVWRSPNFNANETLYKAFIESLAYNSTNLKKGHINFRRSRYVTSDMKEGYIDELIGNNKDWKKSNSIRNRQTGAKIQFYWYDNND